MMGWRARLGFLIPPGNPTVEPEVIAMTPRGVSVHFSRMVAHGATGSLQDQEERNRSQIEHIDETAARLALVKPTVIMRRIRRPAIRSAAAPRSRCCAICTQNSASRSRPRSAAWSRR